MSVYSGRDGKCCCGCAGKHSYTEAHREVAGKNRGYTVDDDDVNDKMVRRVIKLIKENEASADDNCDFVSLVVGTRLYVAYRLPASV